MKTDYFTQEGESIRSISAQQPVLLIFLRHFGCTFCRETMELLSKAQHQIRQTGVRIVLVHMSAHAAAEQILELYGLDGIDHISDPQQELYRSFGLFRSKGRALFGVKNWWRAFVAGLLKGHLIGRPLGDPYQMPGIFLFYKNQIINKFTYRYVSDRPDFLKLVRAA